MNPGPTPWYCLFMTDHLKYQHIKHDDARITQVKIQDLKRGDLVFWASYQPPMTVARLEVLESDHHTIVFSDKGRATARDGTMIRVIRRGQF